MAKRNPSDLGYIEDRWFDDQGQPKARVGQGKRYRARWVDDDGNERAASFAAEKAAKAHLKAVARGEYANSTGKLTFAEFFATWRETQVWAPGTVKKVDQAIGCVSFGNVPLERLRPSHIQGWVKAMVDKPLAPNTVHSRFDHIRAAVRAAVADRAIPFDVTTTVTLPRTRRADAAMVIPTTTQVGDVLHHAPENFTAFVGLCAFGGLRLGEAGGLKVSDINFMRREVRVERQAQIVNGGEVDIRPPKYGSERTVYIPQDLVTMLSEHVRLHCAGEDPDRWMFTDSRGKPLHQNSADYLWRRTKTKAGVSFKLHDLRHFYASGLIAAGCDVVTVQRALGHGSASLTLNTYSHLWPKAEDRTRNAAAQMLNEALTADRVRTQTQ